MVWEIVGIVIFALLILFSIALHEVGHLVPAKLFGVKVTEYMIGFGPKIWARTFGETRYGLKAIPVGGYIRMIGMLPPPPDAPPGTARRASTGRFATMVADARQSSLEEIEPGDEDRVFYKRATWKRMIIMLGGPTMNLILAFVLFAIVLVGIGMPTPTTAVSAVVPCTPTTAAPSGAALADGSCPAGSVPSPAAQAQLQPNEAVVAINGTAITSWEQESQVIRALPAGPAVLTIATTDGGTRESTVEVTQVTRPVYDDNGQPTGQTETTGFLGVRPASDFVRQPWMSVPEQMWGMTVASVKALIAMPVRLYELVTQTLIGGQERDINGPVSVVGVTRLGGDIAASDRPFLSKAATFLSLAASLNLFLFLFNLIPLLPLDGGHVAGAVYESIKRRIAKLRGRPDPGPADVARLLPVAYVVAALLVVMGGIVIVADIIRPLSLG